jgi:hypothetical protein
MPVNLFLRLTAFITVIIGLTLLIFPAFIENFFINSPSHGGDIFIRFLGSTLFGYACLNWFSARLNEKPATRVVLAGNFSTLSIAFFVSLIGQINGTFKSTGILIVLLHLFFASGFLAYLYKQKT